MQYGWKKNKIKNRGLRGGLDIMDFKIIAVDFDGTLCENKWPEIGEANKELIAYLKKRQAAGDKLILWTCRVGEVRDAAVAWSADQGLIFDAVNENLPEVLEWMGGDTRKIFANEYIDDRNVWYPFNKIADILYLCDEKQCGDSCPSTECKHTSDISHAKNFIKGDYNSYWEKEMMNKHVDKQNCAERAELFGRLIDIVEDWLEEKGITVNYISNAEREDAEDAAIIYGSDYDYLADRFAAILSISRYCTDEQKPKIQSWAEKEIEIACMHERGESGTKDGEWDYGCVCYESALKAYKSLMGDGHSGFSIGMTKYILNRLIEGKPLTPIEDKKDVWSDISDISGGCINYQCKRMSSLFKYVYPDGTIKYRDVNRFYGVNLDNPNGSYHSGLIDRVMEELYPICMPYFPTKSFKVVCEEFLIDRKNGDFDTVGMLYFIDPDGVRVKLNRYFKEAGDDFVEIDKDEYEERRGMYQKLQEETNND